MGINAFGLLRGLTEDVSGIQAGQADRRELERRARQDLLQQRLLEAQIGDTEAQAAQRRQPKQGPLVWADNPTDPTHQVAMRADGSGGYVPVAGLSRTPKPRADQMGRWDNRTVDGRVLRVWRPGTAEGQQDPPVGQEVSSVVGGFNMPRFKEVTMADGSTMLVRLPDPTPIGGQRPAGTPIPRAGIQVPRVTPQAPRLGVHPAAAPNAPVAPVVAPAPAGGASPQMADTAQVPAGSIRIAGAGRPITPIERQAGQQFGSVDRALTRMERIARYHPEAFTAAMGFIRARGHGPLGRMANEARGVLSDADAQAVVSDYSNYLLATIPNARPNATTIELEQEASLPPFGSDPSSWTTAFQTMRDRAGTLGAKAGRAAPRSQVPSRFEP